MPVRLQAAGTRIYKWAGAAPRDDSEPLGVVPRLVAAASLKPNISPVPVGTHARMHAKFVAELTECAPKHST
jgi:hypothetical protein